MTTPPDCRTLDLRREGIALHVTLDRPEARNAIDETMAGELHAVFDWARQAADVRAVVLRGAGGNFCAGGDIKERKRQSRAELEARNARGGLLFHKINTMPQAVVAVVEGAALGGGFGMACVADVTIVMRDAKFGMPETTLGIPPAQIAPYVVKRVGLAQARRLAVTAARFDGAEAARLGIAHLVCADAAELEATLAQVLRRIARTGPGAVAAIKEIMLKVGTMPDEELIAFSAARFADCVASDEGREGHAAFTEKRKPRWAGD